MRVGLHDAEKEYLKHKTYPNYALMKISAYHKARGDSVEWWDPLMTVSFDMIYSSKVFDFTPENEYLPSWAIRGGTGYPDIPIDQTLPPEADAMFPDYSIPGVRLCNRIPDTRVPKSLSMVCCTGKGGKYQTIPDVGTDGTAGHKQAGPDG